MRRCLATSFSAGFEVDKMNGEKFELPMLKTAGFACSSYELMQYDEEHLETNPIHF